MRRLILRSRSSLNRTEDDSQLIALEQFGQILREDPRQLRANYCSALAYIYLGQPLEAIAPLEIVLEQAPDDAYGNYFLAQALEQTGDLARAGELYRTVTRLGSLPPQRLARTPEDRGSAGSTGIRRAGAGGLRATCPEPPVAACRVSLQPHGPTLDGGLAVDLLRSSPPHRCSSRRFRRPAKSFLQHSSLAQLSRSSISKGTAFPRSWSPVVRPVGAASCSPRPPTRMSVGRNGPIIRSARSIKSTACSLETLIPMEPSTPSSAETAPTACCCSHPPEPGLKSATCPRKRCVRSRVQLPTSTTTEILTSSAPTPTVSTRS